MLNTEKKKQKKLLACKPECTVWFSKDLSDNAMIGCVIYPTDNFQFEKIYRHSKSTTFFTFLYLSTYGCKWLLFPLKKSDTFWINHLFLLIKLKQHVKHVDHIRPRNDAKWSCLYTKCAMQKNSTPYQDKLLDFAADLCGLRMLLYLTHKATLVTFSCLEHINWSNYTGLW